MSLIGIQYCFCVAHTRQYETTLKGFFSSKFSHCRLFSLFLSLELNFVPPSPDLSCLLVYIVGLAVVLVFLIIVLPSHIGILQLILLRFFTFSIS
jgi:hypothetical protein